MYKYVLNSVLKISVMFAKYFEYYTIILGGPFCRWHAALYLSLQGLNISISHCSEYDYDLRCM